MSSSIPSAFYLKTFVTLVRFVFFVASTHFRVVVARDGDGV